MERWVCFNLYFSCMFFINSIATVLYSSNLLLSMHNSKGLFRVCSFVAGMCIELWCVQANRRLSDITSTIQFGNFYNRVREREQGRTYVFKFFSKFWLLTKNCFSAEVRCCVTWLVYAVIFLSTRDNSLRRIENKKIIFLGGKNTQPG